MLIESRHTPNNPTFQPKFCIHVHNKPISSAKCRSRIWNSVEIFASVSHPGSSFKHHCCRIYLVSLYDWGCEHVEEHVVFWLIQWELLEGAWVYCLDFYEEVYIYFFGVWIFYLCHDYLSICRGRHRVEVYDLDKSVLWRIWGSYESTLKLFTREGRNVTRFWFKPARNISTKSRTITQITTKNNSIGSICSRKSNINPPRWSRIIIGRNRFCSCSKLKGKNIILIYI